MCGVFPKKAQQEEIKIFLKRNLYFLWDAWTSYTLRSFLCKEKPFSLLSLVASVTCLNISQTEREDFLISEFEKIDFVVKMKMKHQLTDHFKFVSITSEKTYLFVDISPSVHSVRLKVNISNMRSNASIQFIYEETLSEAFEIYLPSDELDVQIPVIAAPRCYIATNVSGKMSIGHVCRSLQMLLKHMVRVERLSLKATDHNIYFNLNFFCENDVATCQGKFVSWNKAHEMCKRKGMHLPSVHSVNDLNHIAHVVKNYECQASQMNVSVKFNQTTGNLAKEQKRFIAIAEKDYTIEVMYQTIAIYLGLNTKVSFDPVSTLCNFSRWVFLAVLLCSSLSVCGRPLCPNISKIGLNSKTNPDSASSALEQNILIFVIVISVSLFWLECNFFRFVMKNTDFAPCEHFILLCASV